MRKAPGSDHRDQGLFCWWAFFVIIFLIFWPYFAKVRRIRIGKTQDVLLNRGTLNSRSQEQEDPMPAIASLEDLKSAQKDFLEAKDLNELKTVFKRWRKIGWKNVCKLWLEERTPEQLKGEGND
jgi:hypothetical protein